MSSVQEKGKGFWKINNSILNYKDYQDMINDIILKYSTKINNDLKNYRLLWDAFKVEVREITMTFSKIKAKETKELTRTLEKNIGNKGNNKITELRTISQRESQNS